MKTLKINFPKGRVGDELLYFMGADWKEEISPMRLSLIEKVEAGNPIELNLEETKALYWEVENAADIKADHLDHENWNQLQQYHLNNFGKKLYKFIASFIPLSELQ